MNERTSGHAVSLHSFTFPASLRLLVLAPHPDDFDAIGVTMRFFWENGNPLRVVVVTAGASGVEDSFCSPPTAQVKADLREQEQRDSCRFFGLAESHLEFLRFAEDETGHPLQNPTNAGHVRQQLSEWRPSIVFLPHGHDTNAGHRRVYAMFREAAQEAGYPLAAFLNRDPKTIQMRGDAYLAFGEEAAVWKGELLRFHRSQHQRNLNQRGHGLDERILSVNRQIAEECAVDAPYAEIFELEFFGASQLEDILK